MGHRRERTTGDLVLRVGGLRDGLREGLHWVEAAVPVLPSTVAGFRGAVCLTTPPQRRVVVVKQPLRIALMVRGRTGTGVNEDRVGRGRVGGQQDQRIWGMAG